MRKSVKRLFSGILAMILFLQPLSPVIAQGISEDTAKEIVSFENLSDEIANQSFPMGEDVSLLKDRLYFPEVLKATVTTSSVIEIEMSKAENPVSQTQDDKAQINENQTEKSDEAFASEASTGEDIAAETDVEEELTNITWVLDSGKSDKEEFSSETAGDTFVFVPVLPDGYVASCELPTVSVRIEAVNAMQADTPLVLTEKSGETEIILTADAGVFPEGAALSVREITDSAEKVRIEESIKAKVGATKKIKSILSFDITVHNAQGQEIQPDTGEGKVKVSFELPDGTEEAQSFSRSARTLQDSTATLEYQLFHIEDSLNAATPLETYVNKNEGTAEAEVEHFSVYTLVEFEELGPVQRANVEAEITASDGEKTYYDTIEEAFTMAQSMNGCTVKLLKEAATEAPIDLTGSDFTLDLNGKSLTYTDPSDRGTTAIEMKSGAKLSVKDSVGNGGITATNARNSITVDSGCTLTLYAGSYTGIDTMPELVSSALAEGVDFESLDNTDEWISRATIASLNMQHVGNVRVGKMPAAVEVSEQGGGVHYYDTIAEAVAGAISFPSSTLKLNKDISLDSSLQITGGTFNFNLNGHTLTLADGKNIVVQSGANITFMDSVGTGKISNSYIGATIYIAVGAKIKLQGGSYENRNSSGKTITIVGEGNIGDLLAEGYIYRNLSDNAYVSDTTSHKIGSVKVVPAPLKITNQPQDKVVQTGYSGGIMFSVTAEATDTHSYKWYSVDAGGTENYLGEMRPQLAIEGGKPAGQYRYFCEITCTDYKVRTNIVSLYVVDGNGAAQLLTADGQTTPYPTVETAIEAAKSKAGSTVKLMEDVNTAETIELSEGSFTIDLNGHTWTAAKTALYIKSGADITLKDSATGGVLQRTNGCLLRVGTTSEQIVAKLTIESGTYNGKSIIDAGGDLNYQRSGTVVNISGGKFSRIGTYSGTSDMYFHNATVNISGGNSSGLGFEFSNADAELSGGEFGSIRNADGNVAALLKAGYGYRTVDPRSTANGQWVNKIEVAASHVNDLAHSSLTYKTRVEKLPLEIKNQPVNPESAVYGYASAPAVDMFAERTLAAPAGSKVMYRLWKVKSGAETVDTPLGNADFANSKTLPTGLSAGENKFYIAAECDGAILRSEVFTFTVEKALPTVELNIFTKNGEPFEYGKEVFLEATVTGVNGEMPDGTVTFKKGSDTLETANYDFGTEKYTLSSGKIFDAGNHSFTAVYTPSENDPGKNYLTATSAAVSKTITKANQEELVITEVTGKKYGDAPFNIEAVGGSGTGTVSLSVPAGNNVLSLSGNTATIIGTGTVRVTAVKAADDNYHEKTATLDITVIKGESTIDFKSGTGAYADVHSYTGIGIANPTAQQLEITGAAYSDVIFSWYPLLSGGEMGEKLSENPSAEGSYKVVAAIPENSNQSGSEVFKIVEIVYPTMNGVIKYNGSSKADWFGRDVAVTADGYTVSDRTDGSFATSYTFNTDGKHKKTLYFKEISSGGITQGQEITVNIDKTAPVFTGENDGIIVRENKFRTLLNDISFEHFFKDSLDVGINASDLLNGSVENASGIYKYFYYVDTSGSQTAKTVSELDELRTGGSFTGLNAGDSFSVSEDNKYVIYAYALDRARNRSGYISTNGLVIDKQAPTLSIGIASGDLKDTSADVTAILSEQGTVYFILSKTQQTGITQDMIKSDTNKHTLVITDTMVNLPSKKAVSSLEAATEYYLYGFAEDMAGNLSDIKDYRFNTKKLVPKFNAVPQITGIYGQKLGEMAITAPESSNGAEGAWKVAGSQKDLLWNAGSYTNDVIFEFVPTDTTKYENLSDVAGSAEISPRQFVYEGSEEESVIFGEVSGDFEYDGTPKTIRIKYNDDMEGEISVQKSPDKLFTISADDITLSYENNINAGTATVTITGKRNFAGSITRTFTIEKAAAPAIAFPTASELTYGQKLSQSTLTGGSTRYGSFSWADANIIPTVTNSGYELVFTPSPEVSRNYDISEQRQNVSVTVNKASVVVNIKADITGETGSRKATFTATVSSEAGEPISEGAIFFALLNTDGSVRRPFNMPSGIPLINVKATYEWENVPEDDTHMIRAFYANAANYSNAQSVVIYVDARKQSQAALSIDSIPSKTYGDAEFTLSTIGGSGTGAISYSVPAGNGVLEINNGKAKIIGAGSVTVTATKAADTAYNEASASIGITVAKKKLIVKADDKLNIIKTSSMPAPTHTVIGLVNGDVFSDPDFSTTAMDTSTIGEFEITVSGGTLKNSEGADVKNNYEITYQKGRLTIVEDVYEVIVIAGTGSGNYSEGQTVNIKANDKPNYIFTNWSSSDGITFTDASAKETSFVMPAKAVTVTANYRANSGGGSALGGSSSSGGGGGSSSGGQTTQTPVANENTNTENSSTAPDKMLTAEITINAILGQNGVATAEIPEKALAQAIQKAKEEAKKSGHKDKALSVKADLSLPKNAKGFTLELSENALNTLISEGVNGLDIETPLLRIRFDKNALSSIKEQSKGSIKISAVPSSKLSENAKKIVGTRPVFDITLSDEKAKKITDFGNGTATVYIPYTLTKNEAVGGIYAMYIDEKGKASRIDGSAYDGNSGSVIFTTNHFSIYAVGYTAPSEKYTDIGNHWAKDAIDYVVGRGLITGADDKFSPNAPMTRQMLVTALGKLSEVNVKGYTESSFTDVAKDSSYSPYIEWAYKNGIVSGIGESKFAPNRAITREEIAVIFERYAKVTGYTLPVTREASVYADEKNIGNAYRAAVTAMQQAGIMMGGKGNKFNPKGNATRAEVSSMLSRYIKLTISPETAAGWALNDVGKYLFYKDGKALTGEQVINGVKYFFNDNGVLKTGWVKDGSSYRYYAGNIMQKGWLKLKVSGEEKSYYLNKDGLLETGKWIKIDGKWYYFYADGSLAVNTEIDGYTVDENGVRKEKK